MMHLGNWLKKSLCYTLMLSLMLSAVLSVGLPADLALAAEDVAAVGFSQVDNSSVSASLIPKTEENPASYAMEDVYKLEDRVRVSIVLEEAATIEAGFDVENISENSRAMSYRKTLKSKQDAMKRAIEKALGEDLTVKWNLTLAANLISAEVAYGQIDIIRRVDGVSDVVIEQQYQPMSVEEETAQPNMTISTEMTGMKNSWLKGYTGAGSRVAIIDTGIDVDHQSFDGAALDYALAQNANSKGMDKDTYLTKLDLLDADKINDVMDDLNIVGFAPGVRGADVYHNTKLAFAFNYIDRGYDYVDHNEDEQSDHGSHVAGIAAANRFIVKDGGMVDAIDAVNVAGTAPDAQLMVMKVFGKQGGAYDSDYMAAIEDAIILGADSINLSLGTSNNGYSTAGIYQQIMESLTEAGAVVCMAAGNDGDFVSNAQTKEQTGGSGLLYTEDVMYDHIGSPASYTNSMAVASVDNQGSVSDAFFSFDNGSLVMGYSETIYNDMEAMTTMDKAQSGGTEYDFVMLTTLGKEEDFSGIDVDGKIVFIKRGELAFYDKAHNAVKNGAVATVIYNNEEGTIGMNMSDYKDKKPAVAITRSEAEKIMKIATEEKTSGNVSYYTGKMRVHGTLAVNKGDKDSYVMSSFSSWGTTGDLALKPEITAPGGSIYSVNGSVAATDKYKTNSGTSMATPQVAGITAAIGQYIRDNELCGKFNHSSRQIAQSLLMCTAIPMKDANGNYYPLLQQGAGLANGENAVNAGAYIMMEEGATPSYADGKVKAELGDDPERTGKYEFEFTIYNTENAAKEYALSAELFTFDVAEYPSAPGSEVNAEYMLKSTKTLAADATFLQNGAKVSTVNIPALASVKVKAELTVSASGKEWLEKHFAKGTYIQGLVFAKPVAKADGAVGGSTLHIPVLAFWGNWTDPAMFDAGSWKDGKLVNNYSTPNTTDNSRTSYAIALDAAGNEAGSFVGENYVTVSNADGVQYKLGGNPLVKDEEYLPERNAISAESVVDYWHFLAMRDSVVTLAEIKDVTNSKTLWSAGGREEVRGEYYYKSGGYWAYTGYTITIGEGLDEVESGSKLAFSLTRLPEYYDEGKMGENSPIGSGATVKVEAVVDNVLPVAEEITYSADSKKLNVKAKDENYVAAVVLYSRDGKEIITYCGADSSLKQGESSIYSLQLAKAEGEYLLQIYDYAMNTVTYRIELDDEEIGFSGAMLAFDAKDAAWVQIDEVSAKYGKVTDSNCSYTAAVAVGSRIYAIAYGTELYALDVKHPEESAKVGDCDTNILDLAYNAKDGYLYGVSDENKLIKIDKATGKATVVGVLPIETNTLACDSNGTFYSNLLGSGKIYAYTLDALKSGDKAYDVNGDGVLDMSDVQAVLDYASGKNSSTVSCDMNEDGKTDTYDAYLLLQKLPKTVRQIADCAVPSAYLQAMEIDPNNDTLYWASYATENIGEGEVGFAYLYQIDTAGGEVKNCGDLNRELSCLVILDKDAGSGYAPLYDLANIAEAEAALTGLSEKTQMNSTYMAASLAAALGVENAGENTTDYKTVEVEIVAKDKLYNGLYKVTHNASLEFVGAGSAQEGLSVNAADGSVTVAVAGVDAVMPGDTVATVKFKAAACADDVTLQRVEENADRPASSEQLESGTHSWGEWTVSKAATCKDTGLRTRQCANCPKEQTEVIAKDANAHEWGVSQSGSKLEKLETTYKECKHCGRKLTEITLPSEMTATTQDSSIGCVWAKQHYLDYGLVTGAGVEKVESLATSDTDDNTLRYLVTLSAVTADNAKLHLHLQAQSFTGSGHGMALKKEQVESVGWDADDTEYDITLAGGAGVVKFYAYENSTQCTPFEIYFQTGSTGERLGRLDKVTVEDIGSDPKISALEIWDSKGIVKTYLQSNDDKSVNDLYIWLNAETAKDAHLLLKPEFSGSIKFDGGVEKLDSNAIGIDLSGGTGSTAITVQNGNVKRVYNLHFGSNVNRTPSLKGEATGAVRVKVGTEYKLDLQTVFDDVNNDELNFSYSLNGAKAVDCDRYFSYTPDAEGEYVFEFIAKDGKGESPTYTLTLTATDTDAIYGDVNGDGKITMADVLVLERYLAEWTNVDVEAGADVNGDSKITMADVLVLERYLAEWQGIVLGGSK